jgi:preprotein translocase subunit SecA
VNTTFPLGLSARKADLESRSVEDNGSWLVQVIKDAYNRKASMEHAEALRGLERFVILNAVDRLWQEHLYAMDGLREAVYLRAFAQKDPLVEYKNEAFAMFGELMDNIKLEVLNNLFRSTTNLQAFENLLRSLPQHLIQAEVPGLSRPEPVASLAEKSEEAAPAPKIELPIKRELPKVGRNDPCPCGSGKKFKNCCGRTA